MTGPARYFAYGANLDARVLTRRGITVASAERGRLPGYRLVFEDAGVPLVEPAFATVRPDDGAVVHGAVYTLTEETLARLDAFEGRDNLRVSVRVALDDDRHVEATTYRCCDPTRGLRPSRRYLKVMIKGARAHGLPDPWIETLEATETSYIPGLSEIVAAGIGGFDRINRHLGFVDRLFHRRRGEDDVRE